MRNRAWTNGTPVEEQVAHVADRLAAEYGDTVGPGVVRDLVDQAYSPYRQARVTQFVPVLVDRTVRQRLRSAAH
jgi:hypothetical protein